ncbi:amino acid ABC transporter permease [Wohlfahrtiimonas chitiniclastica]|uniref:L-cystine transport system permease protein tcyB n=2 Tax=Wohlfahrtiimonas chitiniclastica TaxID=400946 RepID=L8XZT4_9GAMM|nr:amino acid ABC transporter permease [Wohlfahrtiimonas chitiniclastica]ELV08260.1 L-cystine transport system permease protein tcyB [Wohlfahrtiimonas chitiniclastica SH04]MBS7816828.1 amino acid ABC transporter permease [Wohlfahrtiimonas chitiniclastica]MBS7820085.1 amino acid ABC transporter permease [Wohlfahrtiimonas chitiniclastica]MBS7822279.1 amino acid ABC transporter permease [Wohlfahrtiimonas chitiniclastica]MBS7824290.1 amino acid ABC transporter permease [Wohlfahrtiimonas chitinicla
MQNLGLDVLDWITFKRLAVGLYYTLEVAVIAIVLSVVLGIVFGWLRTLNNRPLNWVFKGYLEIVRILPTLVILYVLYYILPSVLHVDINGRVVGIIAFTFWGAAEMSDIIRSSLISIPKHQRDSGLALGLNQRELFWYVLLPQAWVRALPAALNLAARIIMTTSLLVLIGVQDITKVGKEIIEYATMMNNPMAPFWIYGVILLTFFLICYPLSRLAARLARTTHEG